MTALIALKMLFQKKSRVLFIVVGLGALFFLGAAQMGLLVAWCHTTSGIINHADADIWVMAEQTAVFDYGTPISRNRIYQVRSVAGVDWAEGMFIGLNTWQRKDGRRINIELVGLDSTTVGGPWKMKEGNVEVVHLPDSVIVDELYQDLLGVHQLDDEAEMYGKRVVVRGISQNVRTFTASPFIFTSIPTAIKYDRRYRPDEITYVLVRCAKGCDPAQVAASIRREVPNVEVLTSREFAFRTTKYWMLETGAGASVVLTTFLALVIGLVVTNQTLFTVTQEYLGNYATLLAVGFSRGQLIACVLVQGLLLTSVGILIGSASFYVVSRASARTTLPLETTPEVFGGLVLLSLLGSVASSLMSVRTVVRIDPAVVFRA